MSDEPRANLPVGLRELWRDSVAHRGFLGTLRFLVGSALSFLRDSTPARRRQRYGDVEYDWDFRVDTTSATVGWHDRFLGLLHSPYQPSDPALFHEILASLQVDLREFTFIDVGSGKGRVLLMAADYPFRRILGLELLPELNRVAQENLRKYQSAAQQCFNIESVCADARTFVIPPEPIVLYLFNPLPESGLLQLLNNLEHSLKECPRKVYVLYHNPLLEHVLSGCDWLQKLGGTHQYSIYASESNIPC